EFHFSMHVRFGEGGKLWAFHADVGAFAMNGDAAALARVSQDAGDVRTSGLVECDMRDKAIAKEGRDAMFRAVDELGRDKELAGSEIFLERTDRADGNDALDAEQLHRVNIRAIIDFSRKNAVSARVTREKRDLLPFDGANHECVRRIPKGRLDTDFPSIAQA